MEEANKTELLESEIGKLKRQIKDLSKLKETAELEVQEIKKAYEIKEKTNNIKTEFLKCGGNISYFDDFFNKHSTELLESENITNTLLNSKEKTKWAFKINEIEPQTIEKEAIQTKTADEINNFYSGTFIKKIKE